MLLYKYIYINKILVILFNTITSINYVIINVIKLHELGEEHFAKFHFGKFHFGKFT